MPLQNLAGSATTDPFSASSFPTRKRSNKRKRASRNFEKEECLAMCLVNLASGCSEILNPPVSFALNYLEQENDLVFTKTTVDEKKDQEKTVVTTKELKKNQKPSVYVCNVCNESFSCYQALGGHKGIHRSETKLPGLKESVKSSTHECDTCGKSFLSGQALGGHMRVHYEGVIGSAKKRRSGGSAEAVKSPSNEGGASFFSRRSAEAVKSPSNEGGESVCSGRVVNDFDLNVTLPLEDTLYCDEESVFMF